MSKNVKISNPMKVITGVDTRWSYANVWEAEVLSKYFANELRYSPATHFIRYSDHYWQETEPGAQAVAHELTRRQLAEANRNMMEALQKLKNCGAQEILDNTSNTQSSAPSMWMRMERQAPTPALYPLKTAWPLSVMLALPHIPFPFQAPEPTTLPSGSAIPSGIKTAFMFRLTVIGCILRKAGSGGHIGGAPSGRRSPATFHYLPERTPS